MRAFTRNEAIGARRATAICVAALLVRVAWAAWAGVSPRADSYDDSVWHHVTAAHLAAGNGYTNPFTALPTAAWPPGYAAILGSVYAIFGPRPLAGLVLNAIAGACTCFLVWRLATITISPRAGLIAAALLAAFPAQIAFASLIMSEIVFGTGVCLLALWMTRLLEDPETSVRKWLVWGVGLGLAALIRAEAAGLVVVPAAALVLAGDRRQARRVFAGAVLGVAVALAPWTYRNAVVFHSFVPLSTSLGRTLFVGHNPSARNGMTHETLQTMRTTVESRYPYPGTPADEIVKDREYRGLAIRFALAHPTTELELLLTRTYFLFRGDHMWLEWYALGSTRLDVTSRAATNLAKISNVYYGLVLLLGAVGFLAWCRSDRIAHRALQLVVVYWVAFYGLIYGEARYHLALMPIVCVMAAWTLDAIAKRRRVTPSLR